MLTLALLGVEKARNSNKYAPFKVISKGAELGCSGIRG